MPWRHLSPCRGVCSPRRAGRRKKHAPPPAEDGRVSRTIARDRARWATGHPGEPNVDLRRILVLRGPNIWSLDPVLEAWLDLGGPQGPRIAVPVEFADRLHSWLPVPE